MRTSLLVVLICLLVAGCAAPRTIVGKWKGGHREGGPNVLLFRPDGTARWSFPQPIGSYELTYTLDETVDPHLIELTGFDRGALAGRTLYGILQFVDPDRLRLDVEPGASNPSGRAVRPATFGDDTRTYVRQR